MSDFWVASIPAVVLFVLVGAWVFVLSNHLRTLTQLVTARVEELQKVVPPARVVELENCVKKLIESFGDLEHKNEDFKEDQYRKVQRYHRLIHSRLSKIPGSEEPNDDEVEEILTKVNAQEPTPGQVQSEGGVSVKRQLRDAYFKNRPKGATF